MEKLTRILAIETSCDETSAAVVEGVDFPEIKTNVIASQIDIHKKTGGVVPEVASRAHVESLLPVVEEALGGKLSQKIKEIDGLAVTFGPGLLGSLLVGVEAAKTLAMVNNLPIVEANHLEGHLYAALQQRISKQKDVFPVLGLIVSGGHTQLVLMEDHLRYEILGETQDDAAGEAFDKVAAKLNLPYPGGPEISKLAKDVQATDISFPRPMINSNDYNFSFSGLKTAVMYFLKENKDAKSQEVAFAFEEAVVDVLLKKTKAAQKEFNPKSILLTGGVAANRKLREKFKQEFKEKLAISPVEMCGDNAGMIGLVGWYKHKFGKTTPWQEINADSSAGL